MFAGVEAEWRRRFLAARVTLPSWGRDAPDRLLYRSNHSGKWELYTWQLASDRHRQLTDRPEGTLYGGVDADGANVWWFDDERGSEFGQWVIQPFDAAEGRRLADVALAYSTGLALGARIAVVGSSRDDGTTVDVVGDDEAPCRIYAHPQYAEVVALSSDETLFCLQHAEHGDALHFDLRVLDLTGRAVSEMSDGPGRGLQGGEWSPMAHDQRLLFEHEREDMPRPALWAPTEGRQQELELALDGNLNASWYPDGRALLVRQQLEGRSRLYRHDFASAALEPLETPPGTIGGARVRPDGQVWYDWSSSSTPFAVRSLEATVLAAPGEPAPKGVPYADVQAGAVHGFVAEPPGPRPHPTIFLIHGGPTAHDTDAYSPKVQAWVDHGFAVVLVNYRGSTGYGRRWRDAIHGNPGLTELEDIALVRDRVVADGITDPSRIVLAGRSWGGYLTLLGLGTQPQLWSLGIADVPVADYEAAFEDEMEPLKAFDRSIFGGSPRELPERYRERSPITYADRLRVPVMILGGANDPRCPIRQIDNFVHRLKDLEKPHDYYRYEAGHASQVISETIHQLEMQIAFASRHLGTEAPK